MTVRKLWLRVLILVVVVTVGINAVIMIILTRRHFSDYMADSYSKHVSQILDYTKRAMVEDDISFPQMAIELQTHLYDPIIRIKLYSMEGELLVNVGDDYYMSSIMMKKNFMGRMMTPAPDESDNYTIADGDENIGIITITRYSSVENSLVSQMFKNTLFTNSLISMIAAIALAIMAGIFVSKKMSRELALTAHMAQDIQLGKHTRPGKTNIHEINIIRESLESLNIRLKLKQKSRESLVDELIHQTRTPLTVLKTHLEAVEDEIVEMTAEEIEIYRNQIDDINTVMMKMNGLIDARNDNKKISTEPFEFRHMINLIAAGLKTQFVQKGISLDVVSGKKVQMNTDKYKLSQAIYNILTNAYKYTKAGGSVKVSYSTENDLLKIEIEDTGIGIDKDKLKYIFDAYYRGNPSLETGGEGIGLYLAKVNIEAINGKLSVKSEKSIGSTFFIEVPVSYINAV